MDTEREVVVFYDERVLLHEPEVDSPHMPNRLEKRVREMLAGLPTKWRYPEHPGRITAIMEQLAREPIANLQFETGRAATEEQLARVHTTGYLDAIFELRGQHAWLDLDTTAVSPGSVEAAEVAAGTAVAAVEAVVQGRARSAFALVRPPGHHAEPARARGFCFFNNIAVAAAHARAELGCRRVLIVDWDVHHGNGTQDAFFADPDVMLFDIHRAAPFYPGTGALEEVGVGLGDGTCINVPLPGGSGDGAYLKAFREILVPATRYFRPDLILVSAGFDADPLDLAMNLSPEGFGAMTRMLQQLADEHCQGRLAFVLEGGYHLLGLSRCARTVLSVLAGAVPEEPGVRGIQEVEAAAAYHAGAFVAPDDE